MDVETENTRDWAKDVDTETLGELCFICTFWSSVAGGLGRVKKSWEDREHAPRTQKVYRKNT